MPGAEGLRGGRVAALLLEVLDVRVVAVVEPALLAQSLHEATVELAVLADGAPRDGQGGPVWVLARDCPGHAAGDGGRLGGLLDETIARVWVRAHGGNLRDFRPPIGQLAEDRREPIGQVVRITPGEPHGEPVEREQILRLLLEILQRDRAEVGNVSDGRVAVGAGPVHQLPEGLLAEVLVVALAQAPRDVEHLGVAKADELAHVPAGTADHLDEDGDELVEIVLVHRGVEGGLLLVDAGDDLGGNGEEGELQLFRVERFRAALAHDARGEQRRAGMVGRVVGRAALEAKGNGDEGLVARRQGEKFDAFDLVLFGSGWLRRGGRGAAATDLVGGDARLLRRGGGRSRAAGIPRRFSSRLGRLARRSAIGVLGERLLRGPGSGGRGRGDRTGSRLSMTARRQERREDSRSERLHFVAPLPDRATGLGLFPALVTRFMVVRFASSSAFLVKATRSSGPTASNSR